MSLPHPPLYFLGPPWFAPVMGWCGLSLAWQRAQGSFGPMARGVAIGCAAMAALIFLAVSAAIAWRHVRHPAALAEDFAHPVRHGFVAAFPVSIILLATVGLGLGLPGEWIEVAWYAGLLLQLAVTVQVLSPWLGGKLPWASITPVLYIPIVGNILVPLAGAPLHHPQVSWAFFGIGAFMWPILTTLLQVRQLQHPLPERLAPSWFILIAPPSVAGASALSMGVPMPAAWAALGVALLMMLAVASRLGAMLKQPFGMPVWAASFPLAALSALLLRCAGDWPALGLSATLMLAVSSLVLLGLSLATLKGLTGGTLLAPEPVAMPVVQSAGQPSAEHPRTGSPPAR